MSPPRTQCSSPPSSHSLVLALSARSSHVNRPPNSTYLRLHLLPVLTLTTIDIATLREMPPKKKGRTARTAKNVQTPGDSKCRQDGAVTTVTRRATGRTVRGRRGSLKDLPEMPIDILTEIFSYLHPNDLLNLVRTNKAFCGFLLDPLNVRMWRICREGAEDIPPPPPFLNEPAFAHLLFAPFCHGCGKGPVQKVIWTWFTRYCRQCLEVKRGYIQSYPPFLRGVPDREMLVEREKYSDFLSLIDPNDGHYHYQRWNKYHQPQLEQFLAQWNAAESSEARKELYEKQETLVVEMRKHERILENWWERRQEDRLDELNEIKKERYSEICNRLKDAGWGPELERLRETPEGQAKLRSIPILHQPTKLTDKAFGTVLKKLQDLLTATRSTLESEKRQANLERPLQLFSQAVEAHFSHTPRTPHSLCRPRFGDFLFEPEIEALLTGPNADGLTVADFAPVIPTLASRWEDRIKDELRAMVRGQVEGTPEDTDPLDLAVALFTCGRCYHQPAMRYPQILAHHCLRFHQANLDTQYCQDIKAATATMGSSSLPFSCSGLNDTLIADGKHFLTVLGMSPSTTTYDDLVNQNVLLRRKTCKCSPDQGNDCSAYTWDAALLQSRRGLQKEFGAWRLMTPRELEAISALGRRLHSAPSHTSHHITWVCALCQDWSADGKSAESHLKKQHQLENIQQCVDDGTIFVHPRAVLEEQPIPLPHVSQSL
ncbi:hypothetical protein PYCCODRAFT_1190763 [Trametes coccinea BRFM310]|uniref:F-box domain-containing protein n=1 Tax=Trametes coccinea (strain BRFM310) TaxID=1353009 RepID=A0A1Y2IB58_TRAC3|nr:hypothetical protein PYCCODRAFT_1190763 [Trametes coccinea BRFM310]